LYDSVQLFAVALTELSRARDVRMSSLSCAKPRPWPHGSSLSNYVRTVSLLTPLHHIIRIIQLSSCSLCDRDIVIVSRQNGHLRRRPTSHPFSIRFPNVGQQCQPMVHMGKCLHKFSLLQLHTCSSYVRRNLYWLKI